MAASATLPLILPAFKNLPSPRYYCSPNSILVINRHRHSPISSISLSLPPPPPWRLPQLRRAPNLISSSAYVTGPPASDPILANEDPKVDDSFSTLQPSIAISWGLLFSLLARHKLRLAASVFSLFCCTACTLSMPILSGILFTYYSETTDQFMCLFVLNLFLSLEGQNVNVFVLVNNSDAII